MRRGRYSARLLACLIAAGSLLLGLHGAGADDPATGPEAEAAKKFQAYAKTEAAAYELHAESAEGRKLALVNEPILRWSNPLGARKAHGDVFVWTDEGRPAAVLSLYEYTTDGVVHEHHEFCSLATGALVTAGPGNRDWSPQEAGVKLTPIPDAPEPAATPIRRLSQMRELAGRFSAEKTTRQDETRPLRLLTQPVHRYASELHKVTDGALFSLVEATDPEVFLIVEARPGGGERGKGVWHYGFVRMTSVRVAASLDGRPVWEGQTLPWSQSLNRADLTYTAFSVR